MPFISKLLESSTFHRACFDGPAKWWLPLLYYTRQLYYTCVMTLPPSAMIECLPKRIYFKHLYPCILVALLWAFVHLSMWQCCHDLKGLLGILTQLSNESLGSSGAEVSIWFHHVLQQSDQQKWTSSGLAPAQGR